jgi:hypothetical protein
MKWNEIVSLNETFSPVCDIKDENNFYWKQFICHNDFYKLLENTINMYKQKEKSVWLQGTFGSGKTHATTVIKNLFSKNLEDVNEYINNSIKEARLKPMLLKLRENLKTFPIILKGSYHISDSKTFGFAIQQEVINALKNANINDTIANSYSDMINRVEMDSDYWQGIIEKSRLIDEVDNIEELKIELNQHNSVILKLCENELIKRGMNVITSDIIKFLEDTSIIVKKHGYDSITIYWDEFTPILEVERYNDILMMLQNLSENIKHGNVFLFIVAHRTLNSNKMLKEDISKVYDRFELTHYRMEDITTYVLLANSIIKNSNHSNIVESLKHNNDFKDLTKYVLSNEDNSMNVNNLFEMIPIHPYSGLILSLIARQLKSSNRSIFSFLYDAGGFNSFLENETNFLMDISYLWDYFLNIFEEDEKLSTYLSKYSTSKDIQSINSDYLVILKAILLLNILNKVIGGNELEFHRILKPNKENLEHIFRVTKYHSILDDALEIIHKKYITKDADGLYLVSSATLPENEISNERQRLKDNTYKNIINILSPKESEIKNIIKNGILRYSEFDIRESSIKDYDIKRYSDKFKFDYALNVMIFFSIEENKILYIKNILNNLAKDYENIIFLVIEESFSNKRYEDFINYSARSAVARKHNHEDETQRSKIQAEKLVEQYINNLRQSAVSIYYMDDIKNGISIGNISNELNSISKKIFSSGADNSIVSTINLWNKQNPSKNIPEKIITSLNRDELNSNLNGSNKPLLGLIKDNDNNYVLGENFNVKDENSTHFLVAIINEINHVMDKKKKSGEVNLTKSLKFLMKPPYGLYANPISFAILSFALKQFEGKFYEVGNGRKIEGFLLRDKIVEIFNSFEEKTKIDIRVKFGTESEDAFVEILKELFSLEDGLGLIQYTFKIKEWLTQAKYPLWTIKYETTNQNIITVIDKLTTLINAHDDDIKLDDIKDIVSIINTNSLFIDLKLLLIKKNFSMYFDKFIKSLNLKISPSEYEEIYNYIKANIRANIDSDIAGWNEDKVVRLILEWHNKQLQNTINITPPVDNEDINNIPFPPLTTPSVIVQRVTPDEIKQFKNRIKYLNLSPIVIDNVDDDIELYNVLKKYIEN